MELNPLFEQFQNCSRIQFNGQLDVKDTKERKWSFYYRLGRLIWATGGVHQVRCWRRQLMQHCPQVDIKNFAMRETDVAINCWDYHSLTILRQRHKLKMEQIAAVVESTIAEHLFDVTQQAMFSSLNFNRHQENILDTPLTFSSTDFSLKQMQQAWGSWCNAGLAKLSPNLTPVLRQPEQLQQRLSAHVYQNFVTLMNGKDTLRDLAVIRKQDLLQLTCSLIPYIRQGLIELVEVPDLPKPVSRVASATVATPPTAVTAGPLIACIDDSPQTCQMLEQILTSKGLRFMSIQDSVQALPALIEHKPDLIFLDLVMPIANGYEVCAQLRRVSLLSNTPVIILTGSDGFVDRVRAKVVGASDFLTKPVDTYKVLAVVRKYLLATSPPSRVANPKLGKSVISH